MGRTWWAHFEFTRTNIEPTILRKKIEDAREAGAILVNAAASPRNIKSGERDPRPSLGDLRTADGKATSFVAERAGRWYAVDV